MHLINFILHLFHCILLYELIAVEQYIVHPHTKFTCLSVNHKTKAFLALAFWLLINKSNPDGMFNTSKVFCTFSIVNIIMQLCK